MSTATPPLKTESQPDRNWVSLNRDTIVLFAGTPDEEHWANGLLNVNDLSYLPHRPKDWESALKCSGREWTTLNDVRIAQCKENAIDINNRSTHVTIRGEIGVVGDEGENVITVKGGSHDISIGGPVFSRGRRADVVCGTWSDQSHEPSHDLDFRHLYRAGGGTITFVFGRVKQPIRAALGRAKHIRLPDGAKVLFWRSLGEQAYWWAKFAAVKLGLIKGRRPRQETLS